MPKCRVIDPAFTWGRERRPEVPWDRTIIYETHVRGFTKLHPAVPEELRGTFSGLGRKEVVDYIRSLGVTSVELLPIHAFVNDRHLLEKASDQLLGLQHDRLLRPRSALFRRPRLRVLPSSRRWWRACTTPASR